MAGTSSGHRERIQLRLSTRRPAVASDTLVVRIPLRIVEDDAKIRSLKYRVLREMMREAQYLGNMAIRYAIAFGLEGMPQEIDPKKKKPVPLDTRIYRILAAKRKLLSAGTVASIGRNHAAKMYRTSNRDAWAGRKSLPTFRSAFLPFRHQGASIAEVTLGREKQFSLTVPGFKNILSDDVLKTVAGKVPPPELPPDKRGIALESCFSWKDQGAVEIVARVVSGEYSFGDSQLQLDDRGLMAFLVYRFDHEKQKLDPARVCGVDLGVVIPAVCALSDGPARQFLGDGGDVHAARSKFRAQRRRRQRRMGMISRSVKWEMSEAEKNWIQTYYHGLTRGVIRFCLRHGCGTIHVEDLTRLRGSDLESEYRRLMWIPSTFFNLLAYKAKLEGIEIIRVNPRNTSRRCSECGHIAKENRRSQSQFVCVKCGKEDRPVNADYNAARNLALATGRVVEDGYVSEDVQETVN
jgi:IS605 OrfB family transposase